VRQSLELSSAMVIVVSLVLLARSARDRQQESVTLEPNSHPG
jgi:hypothetical protein